MEVKVIGMSTPVQGGSPTQIVEEAACVCYDSSPTPTYSIAKGCAKSGHMSVWEHISFTFHISGISRACSHQLVRHRHASYSQRSQRYCLEDGFEYVSPPLPGDSAHDIFEDAMQDAATSYKYLVQDGVKPEDARAVLPNACATEIVVTMNARALVEASRLRLCNRAQSEIRELFYAMRKAVRCYCPEVADMMAPQCERYEFAFCPERKSCGKHKTLSEIVGV